MDKFRRILNLTFVSHLQERPKQLDASLERIVKCVCIFFLLHMLKHTNTNVNLFLRINIFNTQIKQLHSYTHTYSLTSIHVHITLLDYFYFIIKTIFLYYYFVYCDILFGLGQKKHALSFGCGQMMCLQITQNACRVSLRGLGFTSSNQKHVSQQISGFPDKVFSDATSNMNQALRIIHQPTDVSSFAVLHRIFKFALSSIARRFCLRLIEKSASFV